MNLYLFWAVVGFGMAGQIVPIGPDQVDEAAGMVAAGLAMYTTAPPNPVPTDPPAYVTPDVLSAAIGAVLAQVPGLIQGVHAVVTS